MSKAFYAGYPFCQKYLTYDFFKYTFTVFIKIRNIFIIFLSVCYDMLQFKAQFSSVSLTFAALSRVGLYYFYLR